MPAIILADASCLILLDKIGQLPLLEKLYGSVSTTAQVAAECGQHLPPIRLGAGSNLPAFQVLATTLA